MASKSRKGIAIVACALALLAAGCNRSSDSARAIQMKFRISPQPPRIGPATVTVVLADSLGEPLAGVHVRLEGDMAHPGMAPVFADTQEAAPGHFVGKLQLTMAGDWVVLVHITLAGGEKIERQVDVRGVTPN